MKNTSWKIGAISPVYSRFDLRYNNGFEDLSDKNPFNPMNPLSFYGQPSLFFVKWEGYMLVKCWLKTGQWPNRNSIKPFVADTTHTGVRPNSCLHLIQVQVLEERLGRLIVLQERKVEYGIAEVKYFRVLIEFYRSRTSVWADGSLPMTCGLWKYHLGLSNILFGTALYYAFIFLVCHSGPPVSASLTSVAHRFGLLRLLVFNNARSTE